MLWYLTKSFHCISQLLAMQVVLDLIHKSLQRHFQLLVSSNSIVSLCSIPSSIIIFQVWKWHDSHFCSLYHATFCFLSLPRSKTWLIPLEAQYGTFAYLTWSCSWFDSLQTPWLSQAWWSWWAIQQTNVFLAPWMGMLYIYLHGMNDFSRQLTWSIFILLAFVNLVYRSCVLWVCPYFNVNPSIVLTHTLLYRTHGRWYPLVVLVTYRQPFPIRSPLGVLYDCHPFLHQSTTKCSYPWLYFIGW